MARIAHEEIERLKKEIPIDRLVTGFGVELKRQGKDLFGRCPFHNDKTPSLSVTPETNLWHCLGVCNCGGDVIAWVMKTRGVSFRHAVELLKNDHPSLAAGDGRVVRKGTTVKLASPVAADADDQQTLRDVVSFYHRSLKESPEALKYLESRGLNHPEMIERFQIGFANRKLGLTLPDKNRKAGEELRSRLQRLGTKKRLELAGMRADVKHVLDGGFATTERHVCELMEVAVSSFRYASKRRSDKELRTKLVPLGLQQPRYGYRRLHVLLKREQERVNHKRVWRVYREAGLSVKRKRRKRLVRERSAVQSVTRSNQEWAFDFVSDKTASGRSPRVLTVVDAYTRECLALEVDTSFASRRVTGVLDRIVESRGKPERVRSDNGPEMTSRHYLAWGVEKQIELVHFSRANQCRTDISKASTASCGMSV